ncbi:MAG: complex I NDUFA9 subunit family protein [Kiloniellales bacterium]
MAARLVTIFGGSGFIGRYLVQRLARRGWQIRVAVRHPRQAQFLKPLGDVGQITPVPAALQHEASIAAAVQGADAVVNLVGLLYEKGRQTFEKVHVEGAGLVARAASAAGARDFVQVSAIGASLDSEADYACSKAAGEAAVRETFPDAVVVRPSIVFGPEDGFFNRFAVMARLSPALPLIGGGHTRFQPVYVGDVAEAMAICLERPDCRGQTYELGGPQVYSFKELMELLLAQIRRRRLLLPIPIALAELQAAVLELLPVPPLTRDQVRLLRHDNVVSPGAPGLAELGITPTSVEIIVPTYLDRYRARGRAAGTVAA